MELPNIKRKLSQHTIVGTIALIMLVALFLYTYRLKQTLAYTGDTARDTLHSLSIWQTKDITLIGAPLSYGQFSNREIYFSSLPLYVGIIGFLLTNFDVIGPILPNIILGIISIPFMYLFVQKESNNTRKSLLATALYALSPLTVHYIRFFWNPNMLIPLSVFFWFTIQKIERNINNTKTITAIFAGTLAGIMFNFHYIAIVGPLAYALILLTRKRWKLLVSLIVGILISLSPLIIFELRNELYLSKSLLYQFNHSPASHFISAKLPGIQSLLLPFLALTGIRLGEMHFSMVSSNNNPIISLIAITILIIVMFKSIRYWKEKKNKHWLTIVSITFATAILLKFNTNLHYYFGIYPIIVWLLVESFSLFKPKIITALISIIIMFNLYTMLTYIRTSKYGIIPLSTLEEMASDITTKTELEGEQFNIYNSVFGDPRAIAIRFFLQRDGSGIFRDKSSYVDIPNLYVIANSYKQIFREERWEIRATPELKVINYTPYGEYAIFHFSTQQPLDYQPPRYIYFSDDYNVN